ncbi:hypothetical protein HMPREF9248_1207 [Fannyhessea vaginae PB189-T1-4]|uniref:Uncharacterized protein n=1 Tax=Fannyhessea vaginae PB189-T1-4 TaxID=866774 RepID=A0ABN0B189_9ACTN|nr:DUF6414 family protein [Fannyhessea vaginae]EFL44556.1 hypothetical protein HMPREF9248_1207 [Fannyhessea vaginae PB189-T1-4]
MAKRASNDANNISFLKVIYFDEEAATDLLCIRNNGKVISEIRSGLNNNDSESLSSEASANIKFPFWPFSLHTNIGVKGELNRKAEKIVNQIFTNDVLSDYLELAYSENKIRKFNNSLVYAYPNSLSYFKLITPYMAMIGGKLDAGDFKLNISMLDEVLTRGKGYYEMLLDFNDNKIILRFNLASFRNAYSLADLVKMNLTYHGVKVGKTSIKQLDIDNEFRMEEKKIDGYELAMGNNTKESTDCVDVYDVLFAGVSYEN